MNQQLKALISAQGKKFGSKPFKTFTLKVHNNLEGVFPTTICFVPLASFLASSPIYKRWPRVTKPIMVGKLLHAFEVKLSNKWLAV